MKETNDTMQEFCELALNLAEEAGLTFDSDEAVEEYLDHVVEAVAGMAPVGTMGVAGKKYPGAETIAGDGQRIGPKSDTKSADEKKAKGAPKAESMSERIYHSLAAKRVRESIGRGRNPSPNEIKEIAETEGFSFDNWDDVENFMKVALCEKLYPSTGPTNAANQLKGDGFPALSTASKEMQKLGPKDGTTGQNAKGARDAKDKGVAPHREYKSDAPKGATQQFEKQYKVCPVCSQKNVATGAHCGACGATLPPHPDNKDGGIPVKGTYGGSKNSNVATDGGTPKVASPYGGAKTKNYYLTKPPAPVKESMPESSRVVIYDLLSENIVNYDPENPLAHGAGSGPNLGSVNSKVGALGIRDMTQDELDRAVGLFQQGETVGKVRLYTGLDLRAAQTIANMMGIGASHGIDRGITDYVAPADLHPSK